MRPHQQCPAAYKVSGQIPIRLKITTHTQRSLRISFQFTWYRAGSDHQNDTLSAIFLLDVTIFTTRCHLFLENRIVSALDWYHDSKSGRIILSCNWLLVAMAYHVRSPVVRL